MKKVLVSLGVVGALMSGAVLAQEGKSNLYVGAGYGVVAIPDEDGIKFSDANNGFIQLGYKLTENFAIEGQYSKSMKDASTNVSLEELDISQLWWDTMLEMNPGMTRSQAQSLYSYAQMDINMNIEASIETSAIYGVYRSTGNLYFKAKAGYLKEETTITGKATAIDLFAMGGIGVDNIDVSLAEGDDGFEEFGGGVAESATESESGFSAGLGVGYKFSDRFFSELEYTALNDDLDMYSLSINFAF